MAFDIILLQWALAITLFFIVNWIGSHSYSIGYMEISLFVRVEEAPALNFLVRVVSPIVYLIVISAILYYLNLDRFVYNIYLVNIYYLVFRLSFNIVTQRARLLNWSRQFLYWTAIIIISYFTYEKLIKEKTYILPDFTSIANELWIIILVFLFQTANQIRLSPDGTKRRKENYLTVRYNYFKKLYGAIIKANTNNQILEAVSYAILIYEDFNRPKVARWIENLKFKLTNKPHTLGAMQFYSQTFISDEQSVNLGSQKIRNDYILWLQDFKTKEQQFYGDWIACDVIISKYNGGSKYRSEVEELVKIILERFYKGTKDTLKPQ